MPTITGTSGNDTLQTTSSSGGDTLNGLGGNDTLTSWGAFNASTLNGGDGNDTLFGSSSAPDVLNGDAEDDTIYTGGSIFGTTTADGGDGNDTILVNADSYNIKFVIRGGAGNDIITASSTITSLNAGDGDDTVYLNSNVNVSATSLTGGTGTDLLVLKGQINFTGTTFSVASSNFEKLQVNTAELYGVAPIMVISKAVTFDFSGFQMVGSNGIYISGCSGNDTITGTSLSDHIDGGGSGNEIFSGLGGDDTLVGGAGSDTISGGDGNDRLYGSGGSDRLTGDAGDDYLNAGAGDDTIDGGSGTDTLIGDIGNDTLIGSATSIAVFGGNYVNYTITRNSDNSITVVNAADGTDTLYGFATLQFADKSVATTALNTDKTVTGTAGNDTLTCSSAGEVYRVIDAGAGDDVVNIGSNSGTLTVIGSGLKGSSGSDTLSFTNNVIMFGDFNVATAGFENLQFAGRSDLDGLIGDAGNSNLDFSGATLIGTTGLRIADMGGNNTIAGTSGNDSIYARGSYSGVSNTFTGLGGNDVLTGGDGNDNFDGGAGDDTLYGGGGTNSLSGGDGDDMIEAGYLSGATLSSATTLNYIDGGAGYDTLDLRGTIIITSANFSANAIHCERLYLWPMGIDIQTSIRGDASNQTMDFSSFSIGSNDPNMSGVTASGGGGDDTIIGTSGADQLGGDSGKDTIYGGGGGDTLFSGTGTTVLYGGDGGDYFKCDSSGTAATQTTMYGEAGNDVFEILWPGNVTADGGDGNDAFNVNGVVGKGNWVLNGGAGDDGFSLSYVSLSQAQVDGGAGNDQLYLSTLVNMDIATFSVGWHGFERLQLDSSNMSTDGQAHVFDFSSFTLVGPVGLHILCSGSSDMITGTAANDVIYGGPGSKTFFGLGGDDNLYGGGSINTLDGGDGDDRLVAGGSTNWLYGGSGNDVLTAAIGNNILLDGGDGNDTVAIGNRTADEVITVDALRGGAGTDTLHITGPIGLYGASFSAASSGFERIENDGATWLAGIVCDNNANVFDFSGLTVVGSNGVIVAAQGGNDSITGTGADDMLMGGAGDDMLIGGGGSDTAVYLNERSAYAVTGNADGSYTVSGPDGTDTLRGIDTINFSDQKLTLADHRPPALVSTVPSDWLNGVSPSAPIVLNFDETVQAGTGSFVIHRSSGDVVMTIDATDASQVSYSGTMVVIDPTVNLDKNATFYVTVSSGAVTDTHGNAYGGFSDSSTLWFATSDRIYGSSDPDTLSGSSGDDVIQGLFGNDVLSSGDGHDTLTGGPGNDTLDGGSNIDTAVFAGNAAGYTITQGATGVFTISGSDGTDVLSNVEYAQFGDKTVRLLPGTGATIDWSADPSTYMTGIRDFDGNDVGATSGWKLIGTADVNGDNVVEHILVNRLNGRWAEVSTESDGKTYLSNYNWAGDTRVVGIYIDPLVTQGIVQAGSDTDSQRRFQNDLNIENIHGILGQNDYNHDGLQEIYFSLTDGTAYLHAYMHADGNIQYANYQNEQQVKDYLTSNGFTSTTWAGWFPAAQTALAAVAG